MWNRLNREHLLFLLVVVMLAVRHLWSFTAGNDFAHFEHLTWAFEQMDRGNLWVSSPPLFETNLRLGGPLYWWFHLPVRLFDSPILGFHIYYFLLELAAISFWIFWGLRKGLHRPVVWVSALLLAFYWDSKHVICENMTIATYLAIPLFICLWSALRSRRLRALIIPGLLLGITVQIHLAALTLVPALVLAVALARRARARRMLVLLVAWAAVFLLLLAGIDMKYDADLSYAAALLMERFRPENFAYRLAFSIRDPLCVLGLALVLVRWIRRREVWGGARFAVLWLGSGYVLLSLALSYMSFTTDESRYALINPARAVLGGVGVVWLVELLSVPWNKLFGRALDVIHVCIVAAAVITGVLLHQALNYKGAFEAEVSAGKQEFCTFDYWEHQTRTWHYLRYFDRLRLARLDELPQDRLIFSGPMKMRSNAAGYWLHRGWQRPGGQDPIPRSKSHLVIAPRFKELDLSKVAGARDCEDFFVIPSCWPASVKRMQGSGRFRATLEDPGRVEGLLLVSVEGRRGFDVRLKDVALRITSGGQTLVPLASCECRAGTHETMAVVWSVYPLRPLPGVPWDFEVQVQQHQGKLTREQITVTLLPPLQGLKK